jgi:hypothetical protein
VNIHLLNCILLAKVTNAILFKIDQKCDRVIMNYDIRISKLVINYNFEIIFFFSAVHQGEIQKIYTETSSGKFWNREYNVPVWEVGACVCEGVNWIS